MWACKGDSVFKSEYDTAGIQGNGERRPLGTGSQLMWGHEHHEGQELRLDCKGSRKLLDFKQGKLLPYIFWKCPLWLQHGEWTGGRRGWKLGAQ